MIILSWLENQTKYQLIRKKRLCNQVNFAILTDHKVKIKQSEKIDKYLDLA